MDFKIVTQNVLKYGRRLTPFVLMGAGTFLSVDAIVKTTDIIDESRQLQEEAEEELGCELSLVEKLKICGPAWVPVIWREGAALGCFYAAFGVVNNRSVVAAALAAALEKERDELDEALRRHLTGDKYDEYRHEVMNNDIQKALSTGAGKELMQGQDDALGMYYEPKTGKMFRADPRDIKRVVDELNEKYIVDGYVPLCDFFSKLKINPPDVSYYIGWSYQPGYGSIKFKTYDYYWAEKDIYITGLDLGLKLDEFVRTWY